MSWNSQVSLIETMWLVILLIQLMTNANTNEEYNDPSGPVFEAMQKPRHKQRNIPPKNNISNAVKLHIILLTRVAFGFDIKWIMMKNIMKAKNRKGKA